MNPEAKQVVLYSRPFCGWCEEAKEYLKHRGLTFVEKDVSRDSEAQAELVRISHQSSVPTLVIHGKVLADFDVKQLEKFLDEQKIA